MQRSTFVTLTAPFELSFFFNKEEDFGQDGEVDDEDEDEDEEDDGMHSLSNLHVIYLRVTAHYSIIVRSNLHLYRPKVAASLLPLCVFFSAAGK